MTALSVNLNAVAMLRNRRDVGWPSVVDIATIALQSGAAGITVHPRPDERHIRLSDVYDLGALMRDKFPLAEFNIEGYPDARFLNIVNEVVPDQVTFVPDDPAQSTSDHGWDIAANDVLLRDAIGSCKSKSMRVALFADADAAVAKLAAVVGADRIEIYTGPYGATSGTQDGNIHLDCIADTVRAALDAGIEVNAGHDLTLENLPAFVSRVPEVVEVSIGHGLTADALIFGYADTVRRYIDVLKTA